jgi:hypothetical protein
MKNNKSKIVFLSLVAGLASLSIVNGQQSVPGVDYNKNSKQGENPAVHNTTPPATPPPKEYPSHPQNTTPGAGLVKGGAKVDVTIPIGKPPEHSAGSVH